MKVLFLGTSAAEWYPAPWCRCKHCTSARLHGGRDIRAHSSAVIVHDILIDMPPDVVVSANRHGVDLTKIRIILVTHPHDDHFNPRLLLMRRPPSKIDGKPVGPRVSNLEEVLVCASAQTIKLLKESLSSSLEELKVEAMSLEPFKWTVLRTKSKVLPLPANHMKRSGEAFIYVIEEDGKKLLYAVDTGPLSNEVIMALKEVSLDLVVCEATIGLLSAPHPIEHMSIETAKRLRSKLVDLGVITPQTPFVLTHISPHWFPPYHEIAEELERQGLILAYDGMVIEV